VGQLDRRRSILDNLKYLPTSPSIDQSPPTPTTLTENEPTPTMEVPAHPDGSPTGNSPGSLTPPPPVGEHQPIAPITPLGSSKPSPQPPAVDS